MPLGHRPDSASFKFKLKLKRSRSDISNKRFVTAKRK